MDNERDYQINNLEILPGIMACNVKGLTYFVDVKCLRFDPSNRRK